MTNRHAVRFDEIMQHFREGSITITDQIPEATTWLVNERFRFGCFWGH